MDGWISKPLKDVICKTKTIDPRKQPDKSFLYVDVSSVSRATLAITSSERIVGKDAPSRARRVISEGDVIFATVRPTLKRIAVVPNHLDGEVCSTGYFVFQPQPEVHNRFLYYFLQTEGFMGEMEKLQSGASYPAVNDTQVKAQLIHYPSISEQKRIVTLLDKAFAEIEQARALAEKNLNNARELFESYLQQVFSQRGEGWEVKPLEDFCRILNGYAFKSGDFSPSNAVKSIKITNVGVYEFVTDSNNNLPEAYSGEYGRYMAYEGDIVIALTRTIISSGLKVAVVPPEYDGSLVNQRVAAIHVDESVMDKEVLQAFLSTNIAIKYVKGRVNELMQPNLSIKDLKLFPVPVPPSEQKNSLAKNIKEIKAQIEQLTRIYDDKVLALNELKKSILQQAFSGQLTSKEVA